MKKLRNLVGWVVAGTIILGGGLTGCKEASAPLSTTEAQVDEKLIQQVNIALTNSPAFKFPDVQVTAYKGKVQLSGFVLSEDQKESAERLARAVPGVLEVENGIALKQ